MRGDGRVYPRGVVYWVAYYLRGKEFREPAKARDGKPALDEATARKFLQARLKEVHADEIGARKFITPKASRLTVGELLEALKADFQLRGKLSNQTESHLKKAVADFGEIRATELTPEKIDSYIEERRADGAANATINRVTQLVAQAFTLAVRRGHLASVPFIRHLSEADNARTDCFTETQFRGVLENLPTDLRDYVRFAAACGMRKSELSALRWDMLQGSTLHIPAHVCKNRKGRVLPLTGELLAIIERQKLRRQVKRNGVTELCPFIFHRDGETGPIGEFRKSWKTACKKAGCVGLFHGLRRFAARALRDAGVPQVTAMKITGHATDSMWRRYSIVCEADMLDAFKKTEAHREAEAARAEKVVSMRG